MKRILICALIMASGMSYAQNVISTIYMLNGDIVIGKLISMNNAGISYVIDGDTINLSGTEIKQVELPNGQIKHYDGISKPVITQSNPAASDNTKKQEPTGYITKSGRQYFLRGELTTKENVRNLLGRCPSSKVLIKKSENEDRAACITGIAGCVLMIAGLPTLFFGNPTAGGCLTIVGASCWLASIPIFIVSNNHKEMAIEAYNKDCARKTASVNLNIGAGSFGVAMIF